MKYISTFFILLTFGCSLFSQTYTVAAVINGSNEVPANSSMGVGTLTGTYDTTTNEIIIDATYANLSGTLTASHLHKAAAGTNGVVINNLSPVTGMNAGNISGTFTVAQEHESDLLAGNVYINLHSTAFGGGEIRGQLALSATVVESEVEIDNGDLVLQSTSHGIILKSSSGLCFRIQVGDDGMLTTTAVTCE